MIKSFICVFCFISFLTGNSQTNDLDAFVYGKYNKVQVKKNAIDTIIIDIIWEGAETRYNFAFDSSGKLAYQFNKHWSQENKIYVIETFYAYNEVGKLKSKHSIDSGFIFLSSESKSPWSRDLFFYDKNGRLSDAQTIFYPDKDTGQIKFEYKNGVVVREAIRKSSPRNKFRWITTHQYNKKGLLIQLETFYQSDNDTVKTFESRTTITYNRSGNKLTEKTVWPDHLIVDITFKYDAHGKLIFKKTYDNNDIFEETFTYNEAGLLEKVFRASKKNWFYTYYKYVQRK